MSRVFKILLSFFSQIYFFPKITTAQDSQKHVFGPICQYIWLLCFIFICMARKICSYMIFKAQPSKNLSSLHRKCKRLFVFTISIESKWIIIFVNENFHTSLLALALMRFNVLYLVLEVIHFKNWWHFIVNVWYKLKVLFISPRTIW